MSTPRKIKLQSFLQNLPLFREMTESELDRIAAGTREFHAARGEVLFRKGDPCVGFHVIVYGQVKLAFAAASGAEKVIEIISAGQSFGEALMFLEKPYIVYAQTLADSLLLHVDRDIVFAELERDPSFARKMLAGMSKRLHALVADLEALSLRSGRERVVGYLLSSSPAEPDAAAFDVVLPTSKAVIASRLNLTPEHFSRILHELAGEGLIDVDGRTVHVLDAPRLAPGEQT